MWHILATSPVDFEKFRSESAADRMPRHLLLVMAEKLGAELSVPNPEHVTTRDRLLARIYGRPHHWEMARRVFPKLNDGDGVFTTGCDSGVPLALMCILRRRKVSFAISFIDPSRTRTRFMGWILATMLKKLLVLVTLDEQAEGVRRSFGRRASGVSTLHYTTDCDFFRPAADPSAKSERERALVAGCGTEQRDYYTLGEALAPMDLDGKVCFVSPNFSSKTRYTMPNPVPANMEFRHFEFDELRTLYQTADVMVVPVLENRSSAGLTAMFEAIACECPVIITETPGIINDLIDADLVIGVRVESVSDLRQAIKVALTETTEANERARRARRHLVKHYSTTEFLSHLELLLHQLIEPDTATTAAA